MSKEKTVCVNCDFSQFYETGPRRGGSCSCCVPILREQRMDWVMGNLYYHRPLCEKVNLAGDCEYYQRKNNV